MFPALRTAAVSVPTVCSAVDVPLTCPIPSLGIAGGRGGSGPANWRGQRVANWDLALVGAIQGCPALPCGAWHRAPDLLQQTAVLVAASRASRLAHSVSVSGCCWRPYSTDAAADRV